MSLFNPRNNFFWMIVAGVILAINGIIQTVNGAQPIGFASLGVGVLLIVIAIVRRKAMTGPPPEE